MFPAFLTTFLFALSAVSAARSTRILGGVQANFWRITFATLCLGLLAHAFGSGLQGAAFYIFLLSGCVGFGIGDTALYQALPRLGSRLSIMLVHCLAAPFAALVEWLWLSTYLKPGQILCSFITLGGVAAALAPSASERVNPAPKPLLIGICCGILAAFGQGFGAVLSRKAYSVASLAGENIDGITAAYQRILAGWVISAAFMLAFSRQTTLRQAASPPVDSAPSRFSRLKRAWPWVLLNGLAGPTLGVSCYQWALATTPTGVVLPIVALTPIAVIPFAHFLEDERPSKRSLLGGFLAVAGVIGLTLQG